MNIAHTGRKLGIVTDARYRFERGVDPAFALPGLELATKLVLELCGGEPSRTHRRRRGSARAARHRFPLERDEAPHRARRRPARDATDILAAPRLYASRTAGDDERARHRPELASGHRGQGRSRRGNRAHRSASTMCASTPLPRAEGVTAPVLTLLQKRVRNARRALAGQGLVEAVTWSFVSQGAGGGVWRRRRRPRARQSDRRRSFRHAAEPVAGPRRGRRPQRGARLGDRHLFEVGQIFFDADETGQRLPRRRCERRGDGAGAGRHWSAPARAVGAFDAKADALALLQCARRRRPAACRSSPAGRPGFIPAARRRCNSDRRPSIGHFGELHPRALNELDVEGPIAASRSFSTRYPRPKRSRQRPSRSWTFRISSRLRAISPSSSIATAPAGDLVKAAQGADRALIADVERLRRL